MTRPFVNWARTVTSSPARVVAPSSERAVAELVRVTRARGERLKVVGAGHSWSPIAATDGTMVRLDALDQVVHLAGDTVRVQAGKTIAALNRELQQAGLALPILGSITAQSLAGAIATGTHGSSLAHGNLASLVRRMVVIDGHGERRVLDGATLEGARVHLGALGVVTELDLDVVPAFRLRETLMHAPFDEVVEQIPAIAAAHEFVKIVWLPHTPTLMVFAYAKSDDALTFTERDWRFKEHLSRAVFPRLLALGGRFPKLIPFHNRVVQSVEFKPGERVGRSDHLFGFPFVPIHRETEMAIPLGDAPAAVRWVRDWLDTNRARCDFLMEIRFVPRDRAWLSPAFDRDTCQLGVYAAATPELDALFAAFRHEARRWNGRPHWGKELDVAPGDLDRWYPRAADFRALARELDPDGVFRNALLDALFA